MTRNTKLSIALVALLSAGAIGLLLATSGGDQKPSVTPSAAAPAPAPQAQVVREDSHRLSAAPEGSPTFVEFLDFECEACGALYPAMEQIRERYEGKLNFVIRYFPNQGHANGQLAAQAVEAAARQGKLEPMYKKMFETQKQWGEAQVSHEKTFIGFAKDLGLDVEKFRKDLQSPEVEARVKKDLDEGLALGVQGTPTLFLNGQRLQPTSLEQLQADIAAAVDQQ